ncbi:MAG TPA: glycosyltransferase family 39 protein [Candidatus Eisenbacteria bacterium]|jgi:4-amino-4-deoxy-L-arabinose transferase-like glycosyltransferase
MARIRPTRSPSPQPAAPDAALALALALAGGYLLAFLAVALARLNYPFQLEWIEGVVLEHVHRVLNGQRLYVAPSLDFVPLNYTPLYYYVCAAAASVLGEGFVPLRLVSLLASLGLLSLVLVLVRRETGRWAAGMLAAGLFAATYRRGGAWLDIARADSLYLMLLVAGACALRWEARRLRGPLLAAGLWTLAFLAKQSAPVVVAPLVIWSLVRTPRRGALLAAALAAGCGLSFLALDAAHGGWFRYYVLEVAGRHAVDPTLALNFPLRHLPPVLIALALGVAAAWGKTARVERETREFFAVFSAGLLASGWHLSLYRGGYDNVLLPAFLAAALAGGLGWGWIASAPRPPSRVPPRLLATLALVVQLALLVWDPLAQIPSPDDRAEGATLVRTLENLPGRVFIPSHNYLAQRAGKGSSASLMPLMDVLKGGDGPLERGLRRALEDSLHARAWGAIVLDTKDWLLEGVQVAGYQVIGRPFRNPDVFWPRTGMRTRPEWVFVPLERVHADSAARP